jgi:hypothetical protein
VKKTELPKELEEALEDPEGFLARHPWMTKRMADKIRRMAVRYKRRRA